MSRRGKRSGTGDDTVQIRRENELRELKQQIQSANKEMRKLGVDTEKAKEELLAVTEPIYLAQY